MRSDHDIEGMAHDLAVNGFGAEQTDRYSAAFRAAKVAAVAVLCARHGASEGEMLEALMDSRKLNAEVGFLVERMEVSAAFVAYIHSGWPF
jgi:hypothetical protein